MFKLTIIFTWSTILLIMICGCQKDNVVRHSSHDLPIKNRVSSDSLIGSYVYSKQSVDVLSSFPFAGVVVARVNKGERLRVTEAHTVEYRKNLQTKFLWYKVLLVDRNPQLEGFIFSNMVSTEEIKVEPADHKYEIAVTDFFGTPLAEVLIEYEFDNTFETIRGNAYTISPYGKMSKVFKVPSKSNMQPDYSSKMHYKASKDGFYTEKGILSIDSPDRIPPVKQETITLILSPISYLNKNFALTGNEELKSKILSFIDSIILQGLITKSPLEPYSIDMVSFQNNSYLHFKFKNLYVFNSLQLNKYEIGKRVFDDVVRIILNPLYEHIPESSLFFGYDMSVLAYTKNFTDKDADPEPIEYKFLIPGKVVMSYKNWEMSNQQVLDASVILMDNDRIELKFN